MHSEKEKHRADEEVVKELVSVKHTVLVICSPS